MKGFRAFLGVKRCKDWDHEIFLKISNYLKTHLEPDILEREVKWALGSITTDKASGGDGIPVELFQILKDDVAKVLHSIGQQIWKRSVFIPVPKKGNAKNVQTTAQLHSSHRPEKNAQNSPSQASTAREL